MKGASEAALGLERSCGEEDAAGGPRRSWIRLAEPAHGLQRVEARFEGRAYAPHRHDTYAIGTTVSGVQSFDYRGESRHSVAGRVFVLHPDELHDGRAGDGTSFGYRILYIAPELILEALGRPELPFVRDPVTADPRLTAATYAALADIDDPLDDLRRSEIALSIAEALDACAGQARTRRASFDMAALRRARDMLLANVAAGIGNRELEAASGLDRWTLARQFRAAYGVSPHRFLIMRRLDRARELILGGASLAEAAYAAGFADQSHMTRRFRQAYGLSPGAWRSLVVR